MDEFIIWIAPLVITVIVTIYHWYRSKYFDVDELSSDIADNIHYIEKLLADDDNEPTDEPKHDTPKNCINCGAPLNGNICEYCGTKY